MQIFHDWSFVIDIISIYTLFWYELCVPTVPFCLMEPVNVQLPPLMPESIYDMHGGYNYTPSLWGHREERAYSALQSDPPSSKTEGSARGDFKKSAPENTGSTTENTGRLLFMVVLLAIYMNFPYSICSYVSLLVSAF